MNARELAERRLAEKHTAEGGAAEPLKPKPKAVAGRTGEPDVFALARTVDTVSILDRIGIEHDEKFAKCPGCGEEGALICKDGGIKCLHDRCAGFGPKGFPGFRSTIDLVMGAEKLKELEAAKLICKWNGIEVPERKKTNGSSAAEPPADDSPELTDADDPRAPPNTETPKGGEKPQRKGVEFRSLGERLRSAAAGGPRYPLGIAPLDALLRGGLRVGKVGAIGGAPGAGKTTEAVQIGRALARSGVAVCILAIDEDPAGIDARNLESIGISRDHAEEPSAEDIELAERELGALPLEIIDDATIEDAFEGLAKKYPNQPRCVIADSIQTCRTRQSKDIEALRERISDVVTTGKRCARDPKTAAILLFTSELARGAYRSKKREEQSEGLASFKESGAIEYGVDVALVLKTAKGDAALVYVEIVKNRVGTRGEFALRLDFETATFTPEEMPDGDDEHLAEFDALCDRVLEVVKKHPGISGRRTRIEVGANTSATYAALEKLEANGAIRNTARAGKGAKWAAILRTVHPEGEGETDA
jgi:KaiC/GvpD/RAD55 family RecA-like ATPase